MAAAGGRLRGLEIVKCSGANNSNKFEKRKLSFRNILSEDLR